MQKGKLETQDYAWLLILVLGYVVIRPYTKEVLKWLLAPKEVLEGEKALRDHYQGKAKVGANAIRGLKAEEPDTIAIDEKPVITSGSNVTKQGQVSNRKFKSTDTRKSEVDKLVEWDDEPARDTVDGDKSDIQAWLDRWDK
jgi:Protein trafficking PGA2